MSATGPALVAAAAGVGFGHAILPDHWLPLAVVGRTRRYPLSRVARLSGLAGVAHVLVSLVLGGVIIAIGLQFRSVVEHTEGALVGSILIATGVAFLALELRGRGHGHTHGPGGHHHHHHEHDHEHEQDHDHDHDHDHEHDHDRDHDHDQGTRVRRLAAIMVPFGAAASPDLTILPVFLAATAAGTGAAIGSLVSFAVVTVTTIVSLTLLATAGGYQARGQWLERWGNMLTSAVLLVIGVLVVTGAI